MNSEKYNNEYFHHLIKLVCVIKLMIDWNICRERNRVQGTLKINRLESVVGFAHSAITLLGDIGVLI